MPRPDREGNWPELAGSERVELKMEGGKGKGRLTLRGREKRPIDYLFQTTFTAGGKPVVTEPLTWAINFATGVLAGRPRRLPERTSWETVTSKEGGFTVEMPAKPSLTASRSRRGPAAPSGP
jgi:hypothetical protein